MKTYYGDLIKRYYFKSDYKSSDYSKNWSGTMEYPKNWYGDISDAPKATILVYNDVACICIGYLENLDQFNKLLTNRNISTYDCEELALEDIISNYIRHDAIWFGERLKHRWEVKCQI